MQVSQKVFVELKPNPDQEKAEEVPRRKYVAKSLRLGPLLKRKKPQRATIQSLMNDGYDGFLECPASDGVTVHLVYFNLSPKSNLRTQNLDNFDPNKLKKGHQVMVELMDNPDVVKVKQDPSRKYVARSMRLPNKGF